MIDHCRSYAVYEGTLRAIVHRFKYGRKVRLGRRLARLLLWIWKQDPQFQEAEVLLPVPLHWRRERKRGFNQSRILAQYLSHWTGIPWERRALRRQRNTPSQTGLSRRQRRLNLAATFEVRRPEPVKDRVCLLIDDVFTTGATLNEVARVLKRAGARKVMAMTLARVSPQFALATGESGRGKNAL